MTTTDTEALDALRLRQPSTLNARRALLDTAIVDDWFAVRVTDDVTAHFEPTRGLLAGETYRIVYAYAASGDIAVIERTL